MAIKVAFMDIIMVAAITSIVQFITELVKNQSSIHLILVIWTDRANCFNFWFCHLHFTIKHCPYWNSTLLILTFCPLIKIMLKYQYFGQSLMSVDLHQEAYPRQENQWLNQSCSLLLKNSLLDSIARFWISLCQQFRLLSNSDESILTIYT